MIKVNNVSLIYPDGTVGLDKINVEIGTGEIVFITGPSGSGKTSFLKLLIGMEYPTEGNLTVLGQAINHNQTSNIRKLRRRLGPVFQDFKLLKGRTVLDNVLIGMRFLNFSKIEMRAEAVNAIDRVGLSHKTFSLVDNLSFGECQRVAIARAIARKPSLIIADEPTGNLDIDNSLNILNLFTSFRDKNTSVIITTHATHLIEGIDNCRKIRIKKGKMSFTEVSYESFI